MFHRADWLRCITNSTWLARDSHVWRKNNVYWRGTVPWLRFGVRKQPQKEVPDMHGISKQAEPPKMSLDFPAAHGHRTWGGFACRAISRSDTVPQSKTAKATAKRCKAKGSWRRLPKTKNCNACINRNTKPCAIARAVARVTWPNEVRQNVSQRCHCEAPTGKISFHWA